MTTTTHIILTIISAFWMGLVVGISFLETPLKFRAQGVTLEVGLAIGRLVFHALNAVELVLGAVVATAIGWSFRPDASSASPAVWVAALISILALLIQRFLLRPVLDRRLDARLRGAPLGPSHHHHVYIVLELAKVAGLATLSFLAATHGAQT